MELHTTSDCPGQLSSCSKEELNGCHGHQQHPDTQMVFFLQKKGGFFFAHQKNCFSITL